MSENVPIVLDMDLLEIGYESYEIWKPESHPHLLIVGGTGSGKSYFLSSLMAKIAKHIPNSQLYLCDYKDIDFKEFADCPRRWSYEKCMTGLEDFYESMQERIDGKDKTKHRKFFCMDEWAAFVISRQDKKTQDNVKNMLSVLLMMGRGVGHHVIIGLQRADSALFPMGGRDQFAALLALGNLSKEQKYMLFPDFREDMKQTINGRGQGFLYLDGNRDGLKRIVVPSVTNLDKRNAAIREGLSR